MYMYVVDVVCFLLTLLLITEISHSKHWKTNNY